MSAIQFEVVGEAVRVVLPGAAWEHTLSNSISTRPRGGGREVMEVGAIRHGSAVATEEHVTTQAVFEVSTFDPDLAEAFVWFVTAKAPGGWPVLPGLKARSLLLRWPAWRNVRSDDRDRFLIQIGKRFREVSVNGKVLATRSLFRRLAGRKPRLAPTDDHPDFG